jgi:hypothetical protein
MPFPRVSGRFFSVPVWAARSYVDPDHGDAVSTSTFVGRHIFNH